MQACPKSGGKKGRAGDKNGKSPKKSRFLKAIGAPIRHGKRAAHRDIAVSGPSAFIHTPQSQTEGGHTGKPAECKNASVYRGKKRTGKTFYSIPSSAFLIYFQKN